MGHSTGRPLGHWHCGSASPGPHTECAGETLPQPHGDPPGCASPCPAPTLTRRPPHQPGRSQGRRRERGPGGWGRAGEWDRGRGNPWPKEGPWVPHSHASRSEGRTSSAAPSTTAASGVRLPELGCRARAKGRLGLSPVPPHSGAGAWGQERRFPAVLPLVPSCQPAPSADPHPQHVPRPPPSPRDTQVLTTQGGSRVREAGRRQLL